ncbi:hypothetical protein Pfo_003653 [Paulownia fortunei]|nr:hypothetical protein Pfo_003653 [Paulownia fortunei]
MQDSNISLVDNATEFDKSLQELRDLSSQLYHAADYCETTFFKAEDKRIVVETTKEYISRAVVTVVDHLGSISTNLESCLSISNSIPETEHKIDILKLRIVTCQQHSHKLALARFYWSADFSRYHCRYILPPLSDSATTKVVSRDTKGGIEAKSENEGQFETDPLFLHTFYYKPSLVENSTRDMEKKNGFSPAVLPVRDGLSILPKAEQSTFQFQEAQKLKRSMISWKLMHNNDITSLIRRGKRILA